MRLLRLVLINCAAGIAVAMLALGGLLALNEQLRRLIFSDQSPLVPLALLGGGFVVTFASVVTGTAIMRLGKDDGRPPMSGGGRRLRVARVLASAHGRGGDAGAGAPSRPRSASRPG
jgi:hypothetical protein